MKLKVLTAHIDYTQRPQVVRGSTELETDQIHDISAGKPINGLPTFYVRLVDGSSLDILGTVPGLFRLVEAQTDHDTYQDCLNEPRELWPGPLSVDPEGQYLALMKGEEWTSPDTTGGQSPAG